VQGGGYDQHAVTVIVLAKEKTQITTLQPQIDTAFEGIEGYMFDDDRGDADYEDDPSVYAYYMNFVVRTPRY
jgi:hypothetical protein